MKKVGIEHIARRDKDTEHEKGIRHTGKVRNGNEYIIREQYGRDKKFKVNRPFDKQIGS